MKKKTKKIARQVGLGAGIVGGIAAAGYVASRLRNRSHELTPQELQNRLDADRAIDFEPGGNFEYSRRDIVGDPSARTSVGLATSEELRRL